MIVNRCAPALMLGASILLGGPVSAQQPRALTAADYARAEKFMPYNTAPLVLHAVEHAVWLPDGKLSYCTHAASGHERVLLDPRRWSRDVQAAHCPKTEAPNPNESVSPDKTRAVFVRNYNLWVRDVASGRERQLTADGEKDFGYATDNPGWEHSDRAIVAWSPVALASTSWPLASISRTCSRCELSARLNGPVWIRSRIARWRLASGVSPTP